MLLSLQLQRCTGEYKHHAAACHQSRTMWTAHTSNQPRHAQKAWTRTQVPASMQVVAWALWRGQCLVSRALVMQGESQISGTPHRLLPSPITERFGTRRLLLHALLPLTLPALLTLTLPALPAGEIA